MRAILLIWAFLAAPVALAEAGRPAELPREIEIGGVEFVQVPEGWFWFSVPTASPEDVVPKSAARRDVRVWLDSYYIGKYEARAGDLERFLNSGESKHQKQYGGDQVGCAVRLDANGRYYSLTPQQDLPATHLSWELASEFARWMGFRLPIEAEWQKAARGTDRRHWPWGNDYPDDTYGAFFGPTDCSPSPVEAYPKGASPYGALNMAGNVWEYVEDWHDTEYYRKLQDGARNPAQVPDDSILFNVQIGYKLLKGGRWASTPNEITIANSTKIVPEMTFRCFGTRFAIDVATVQEHLGRGTAKILKP